ncbi:MAG: galactose-1-epimerase [Vibrionaceae bacterium]
MQQFAHFSPLEQAMTQTPALDGLPAKIIHLHNASGMTVSLMDIGATWLSCNLPAYGARREVLLRSPNMLEHQRQGAYFGATVGRVANRIARASFELNGGRFALNANEGEKCLHGGKVGFDKRRWHIESASAQRAVFSLASVDGDQGFPGNLQVRVSFELDDNNQVTVRYEAHCDADCPVNLTNHAYFNLSGEACASDPQSNALAHQLQICASHYLPVDAQMLPVGTMQPVAGSSFDFTSRQRIGARIADPAVQQFAQGYDHSFVLDGDKTDGEQTALTLLCPLQQVRLEIATTMPAVQVYSGNFLSGNKGLSCEYADHAGVALETQFFPNAVNVPAWKAQSGLLKAGQKYAHHTRYRFFLAAT